MCCSCHAFFPMNCLWPRALVRAVCTVAGAGTASLFGRESGQQRGRVLQFKTSWPSCPRALTVGPTQMHGQCMMFPCSCLFVFLEANSLVVWMLGTCEGMHGLFASVVARINIRTAKSSPPPSPSTTRSLMCSDLSLFYFCVCMAPA